MQCNKWIIVKVQATVNVIQYVEKAYFCFARRPFLEDLAKVNTKTLKWSTLKLSNFHCAKSVQIRSNFWSVFSRIRTEYGYGEIPQDHLGIYKSSKRQWSYMIWKFQNFRYKIFLTRKNIKYFQPVRTCSR